MNQRIAVRMRMDGKSPSFVLIDSFFFVNMFLMHVLSSDEKTDILQRAEENKQLEKEERDRITKNKRSVKNILDEDTNLPRLYFEPSKKHIGIKYESKSMSELFERHPNLRSPTVQPSSSSTTTNHHKNISTPFVQFPIPDPIVTPSMASTPTTHPQFQIYLNQYTRKYGQFNSSPTTYSTHPITTATLQHDLESRPRPFTEERNSTLESALLYESGTFIYPPNGRMYTWPTCVFEKNCYTYTTPQLFRGLEKPVIGTCHMSQEVFNQFIQFGRLPKSLKEPCVNCHRLYASLRIHQNDRSLALHCRSTLLHPTKDQNQPQYQFDSTQSCQLYYNPMDRKGGYRSENMIHPTDSEIGLMLPIVRLNTTLLVITKDLKSTNPSGIPRIKFCQNTLLHEYDLSSSNNKTLPQPKFGESVKNFRHRSEVALGEEDRTLETQERYQRYQHLIEPIIFTLLRTPWNKNTNINNIDAVAAPTADMFTVLSQEAYCCSDGIVFDRNLIHSIMTCDHRICQSPLYMLSCAQVYDAMLFEIPLDEICIKINDPRLRWDKIYTDVMLPSEWLQNIYKASYFSSLAPITQPMRKLISKAILSRCNTRTAPKIIREFLIERIHTGIEPIYNASVFYATKQLILCYLLGNYIHIRPSSRPSSPHVRKRLYEIFTNTYYDRWVIKLIHYTQSLVMTAFRTYLIHSIVHDPALYDTVSDMLNLDVFHLLNEEMGDYFRNYFELHLCDPSSYLYESLLNLPTQSCHIQHLYRLVHSTIHLRLQNIKSSTLIHIFSSNTR